MDYLLKQGGRTDYNYKEIYCDVPTDISSVDKSDCCPGSIIYVISTGDVYILNTQKE